MRINQFERLAQGEEISMLKQQPTLYLQQAGVTLIEVLVTIIILAFGLLGLAGLQAKVQLTEVESYQRAQAIDTMSSMSEKPR